MNHYVEGQKAYLIYRVQNVEDALVAHERGIGAKLSKRDRTQFRSGYASAYQIKHAKWTRSPAC